MRYRYNPGLPQGDLRDVQPCSHFAGEPSASEKGNLLELDFGREPKGCLLWLGLKIKASKDVHRQFPKTKVRIANGSLKKTVLPRW